MACSDSSTPAKARIKRKKLPAFSEEQPQQQEEDQDEDRDVKKIKLCKTWENLDLILTLQSKEINLQRKIRASFDFASSEASDSDGNLQPVSFSRALRYVFDWMQSLLMYTDRNRKSSELLDPCLDYRCWAVIRSCLEKFSAGASPNLFRAVTPVLKQALFLLDSDSLLGVESGQLFENALQCLSSLLASNSRAFYNVGVDLWISCVSDVLIIIVRVSSREKQASSMAKILLDLSALLLEHFASFLRFHPNPKNIFRVFVERLLDQLFEVFVLLRLRTKDGNCEQFEKMRKIVEDVMLNGLFHPAHISGFLSSRGSTVGQEGKSRVANESYHRHLFNKLVKVIREKKLTTLGGFACLLRLFARNAKGQQGVSLSFRGHQSLKKGDAISGDAKEEIMPLFEVFMEFMKPLLLELKHYAEMESPGDSEHRLIELHCILRSMNETLETFIQENIYVRTEDTPEGKHYCFLKEIYDALYSISIKLHFFWSPELQMGDEVKKMLPLIAREIVVGVGYFLEIEYRVLGDDMVIIWRMLLSYLAINISISNAKPSCLLMNDILNLGCKLINVYGELRQVNTPLFALCKAVRFLMNTNDSIADEYKVFSSSFLSSQLCLKAAKALVCSQDLRLTIANAVISVPEGQAGNFIQQLNLDIVDALEWIRQTSFFVDRKSLIKDKIANIYIFDMQIQAEVIGRILCEIYATVLDSLNITATNSIMIGNSLKNLIKTLRPSLGCFLQTQSENINNFFFSITGRNLPDPEFIECGNSICWLFLFFFRLYASSRSLYKQSISLMPPDLSNKASDSLGDLFTTSCCMDWAEKPEKMDGGYFSWIITPSISIPHAIKILSKDLLFSSFAAYAPLVYILHVITIQRLSDLRRLINAFEFFHKKTQIQSQYDSTARRSMKMWKKLIADARKEAVELTNFMTGHLYLLDSKGPFCNFKINHAYDDEWDWGVCSLDEKVLHVAIWWQFCQNIDLWCVHSTKKRLKKFVSYLFLYSLPCPNDRRDVMDGSTKRSLFPAVTLRRISLEFLQDTISYEQMMTYTNVSSTFCRLLKKLLCPVLSLISTNNLDLGSSPEWLEASNFEKGLVMFNADDGLDLHNGSSLGQPSSSCLELKACENLFNLFCKMPKHYGNAKSFSRYATYMLNIERLLLSNLLNHRDESFTYDPFELLRLFVACRRAMKCLVMGSTENSGSIELRAICILFDCPSSILWLFKSVYEVAGLPNAFFGERYSNLVQDMIYSLIDHTSYVFLKISEAKANATLLFLMKETFDDDQISQNHHSLNDNGSQPCNDWQHVELIAEALKEHAEKFLNTFKRCVHSFEPDADSNSPEWNRFSSVISCFQAVLSGLTSASDSLLKEMTLEIRRISSLMLYCFSKLSHHIAVFDELINLCLKILVIKDNAIMGMEVKSFKSASGSASGKKSSSASHIKWAIDFFHIVNKIDLRKFKISCGPLLRCLLKDISPQVAFILRQLFITSATIMRVKCVPSHDRHLKDQPNDDHVTVILFGTSYIILQELSEMIGRPCWLSFAWLDGVLSYFDFVGCLFSFVDPDISKDVYTLLFDLYLKIMGKCLILEGKTASSHGQYSFGEFKVKLRILIKKYIMIPSVAYLKMAIQVIERKIVCVREDHTAIYQLSAGNVDGGMVSLDSAAASIECFKLIVECLSGNNQFLKKSIPNLVGAIINIVLHLQKPSIFYVVKFCMDKSKVDTDEGAVILMCVEVLTKVVGRHSFHMDAYYVSQCFHLPMMLFAGFHELTVPRVRWNSCLFACNEESSPLVGPQLYIVDRRFSVELYVSCCRLMCSTIKHQKSEAERCIHLLEESLNTLLSCLEGVDSDNAKGDGYFSWELGEAIKCAGFLRRVYEEIRHQKDVLGKHAFLLLSNYISTFSGYGPSKAGIRREIDEALKPGLYSLIDICTRDDLQQLHSLLGDGPCRSTLATLLQDYKQNFFYEGKI